MTTSNKLLETRQFKAALALNNVGVSLLERGCFRDALETLRKASDLIKVPFASPDSVEVNNRSIPSCDSQIDRDLTISYRRLARSQSVHHHADRDVTCVFAFDLTVLPDDNLHEAAHSFPCSNSGYAVRVDTCEELYFNFLLECSIIIMNYGIAYRCYACGQHVSDSKKADCLRSAHELLKLAYEVLSNEFGRGEDDIILERIELVSMLVLQGLMQLSYELNLPGEGQNYYSKLGDLHVHQVKRTRSDMCLKSIAPAA
jgi:hypothetical protein